MAWPVEEIPDKDALYRRLAPNHLRPSDGKVNSTAFKRNSAVKKNVKEPDPDVSVDWAKYTTMKESLRLAGRPDHGIGSLAAGLPRALGLSVVHTPDEERRNRAHSSIRGIADEKTCRILADELSKRVLKWPASA